MLLAILAVSLSLALNPSLEPPALGMGTLSLYVIERRMACSERDAALDRPVRFSADQAPGISVCDVYGSPVWL